jgi:PilZ domain
MGAAGSSRSRSELRKKPRRAFHYNAQIFVDRETPLLPCLLSDVSESGARIVLGEDVLLPEHFVLLLTASRGPRRQCRVAWRTGTTMGVQFSGDRP